MAQVTIQPWVINMINLDKGTIMPKTDLEPVFSGIKDVWAKQKITLEMAKPELKTITLTKKPEDYEKGELTAFLNKALQKDIDASFDNYYKEKTQVIQLVFVPYYDRWGLTFQINDKVYKGPVTFVTTANAGVGATLLSNTRLSNSSKELVNKAIYLDAAHEIGHAFGLDHKSKVNEAKFLMYTWLYNSFVNTKSNKQNAFNIVKNKYPDYKFSIDDIYERTEEKGKYWASLHGDAVGPDELEIVQNTIKNGTAWPK